MKKMEKYAVIETGGKQYLVWEGQELNIEKVEGKKKGKLVFSKVLLVKDKKVKVGKPLVKAKVEAQILDQLKDKKIRVAKFRAKSRYRKVQGHRQLKTRIKISKISS